MARILCLPSSPAAQHSRPKFYNIGEAQEKDLKAAFMYIIEVHKEEMNKTHKEIWECEQIVDGNI